MSKNVTTEKELFEGKEHPEHKRSTKWASVRKNHIKANPECALCGGTRKLEVHHIKPFHSHPELELEPTNLITLCEDKGHGVYCHLFFGHLGNYKGINENLMDDVLVWKDRLRNRKNAAS